MKIRTDVHEIIARNTWSKRQPADIQAKSPLTIQGIKRHPAKSISSRFRNERTLGDALSIAQMSSSILQKAMVITARLKSIASQAMVSGKLDTAGISQAVSEIDSSLRLYGENVVPPAQSINVSAGSVRIPVIEDELNDIRNTAGNIGVSGNSLKVVDEVSDKVNSKLKDLNRSIESIKGSMNSILSEYASGEKINVKQISSLVEKKIKSNPAQMLFVQGNINSRNAALLTS